MELRQGYMMQVLDEMRHTQLEMNTLRHHMQSWEDPEGTRRSTGLLSGLPTAVHLSPARRQLRPDDRKGRAHHHLLFVCTDRHEKEEGGVAHTITLAPFEKQFICEDDETILAAGLRQGFNLRYGCKHGGCGSCKALIVEGEVDQAEASSFALMDFEREQGYTLLCSAYPLSDIAIDVSDYEEEELLAAAPILEYKAEVVHITELTHDIRGIRLRLMAPAQIAFKAGQYVDLLVPGTKESRSYSMANPPSRNGEIEIMVKLMPGGLFSSYIEQHLKVGEQVTLQGPYGNFYLRDTGRPALFIAGGSGMAPILSLLRDMAERQDARPVTYFYGARAWRDLFQLEELHACERRLPHFHFVPALSEPLATDEWAGEVGLITEVVKRQTPSFTGMEAYMCGPTVMIDAALALLTRSGMQESNIFYDKFVTKADAGGGGR